ncbi:MAG: FtsW/RodA/SpoVE family cell cycle protein, partial [Phycisphaerae bacterium]
MPALAGGAKPSAAMVIWLAIGLMAVGVVMVFSASAWPDGRWGGGWFWQQPGLRQLVFVAVAAGAMTTAGLIPYRWWRFEPGRWGSPSVMVTAGAVVCLMVVLVPSVGLERHGARRWLAIGPRQYGLGFQPSELAKVAMVLFLAAYMGGGRAIGRFWRGLAPACLVVGAMIGLIGVEDFGTAVLLGMVAGGMLLVGGARLGHLVAVSVPAAAGLAARPRDQVLRRG